jgi:hypothetical protein
MGVCCSNERLDVEEFICDVLAHSNFRNVDSHTLESKLKDYAFRNKIRIADYDVLIQPFLYNRSSKHACYLEKIMECLINPDIEDRFDIYQFLLVVFSFIKNNNNKDNFFHIFLHNVHKRDQVLKKRKLNLSISDFRTIFETYINTVIYKLSEVVTAEMEFQGLPGFEIEEHKLIFSMENCKKYTDYLLQNVGNGFIDFYKFEKFVSDKAFLYNTKKLRENFLKFVRNNS